MNRNSWCLWRSYLHGHLIGVPVAMLCMFCAPARHSKFPYSHGEEWALLGCISSALKAEMLKMWMGCSLCLWVSCVPWSWSQSLPGARLSSKPLRAAVATYNFGTKVTGVQCPDILLGGNEYYSLYGAAFPGFMDSSFTPSFAPRVFSVVELVVWTWNICKLHCITLQHWLEVQCFSSQLPLLFYIGAIVRSGLLRFACVKTLTLDLVILTKLQADTVYEE